MSRAQLEPALSNIKTLNSVTTHFSFLARRHGARFLPFEDAATGREGTSKLQVFQGIFEHKTLPRSLQPLVEPVAERLMGMSERVVAPALHKANDDLAPRGATAGVTAGATAGVTAFATGSKGPCAQTPEQECGGDGRGVFEASRLLVAQSLDAAEVLPEARRHVCVCVCLCVCVCVCV